MRATLIVTLFLTAALSAGCAITGASGASASANAQRQPKEHIVVDTEKMAAVDRAARQTGIAVHWVNPPVKRTR
jgi:hypothetical protein